MSLSKHSIQLLTDLVEIKLSCLEVWDQEDRRERQLLERCRRELQAMAAAAVAEPRLPGRATRLTLAGPAQVH